MRIPALALTVRSLRVDFRSIKPYLLRGVLVTILILALWFAQSTPLLLGAPGLKLYNWLVWVNFLLVTVLGVSMFSSVITEEKEERTLGLLQMAGFNALSIMLGKSIGQLLTAALLLGVQLPFALLSVTLGGVSFHQVMAAYTILLAYLLFVYGASLLSSVVCQRNASAARLTGLIVVGLLLLPWIGGGLLGLAYGRNPTGFGAVLAWLLEDLFRLSAFSGLAMVSRTGFDEPLLGPSVQFNLLLAGGCVLAAWLLFPLCNRQEGSPAPLRGFMRRSRRSPRNRPSPNTGALVWKDFHFMAGGRFGFWGRIVAYGGLFIFVALSMNIPSSFGTQRLAMFGTSMIPIMTVAVILELSLRAGRIFHEEIKWKTLSSLVLLPFPIGRWAYGKVWAHSVIVIPALSYLFLSILLAMEGDLVRLGGTGGLMVFFLVANAFLFVHMAAYLSLFMRRGAFALTIVAYAVGWMLLGFAMAGCINVGGQDSVLFVLGIAMIGGGMILHGFIARRLKEVAGR